MGGGCDFMQLKDRSIQYFFTGQIKFDITRPNIEQLGAFYATWNSLGVRGLILTIS